MSSIVSRIARLVLVSIVACLAHTASGTAAPLPALASPGRGAAIAAQDPALPKSRVLGVVRDQSGAAIRGATVEIRGLDSPGHMPVTTNESGRFAVESLPAGRYRLTASFPGFDASTCDVVIEEPGRDAAADIVLAVARQESTVVVTAPSTLSPIQVETDPRAPRQPIPAHDGADYLKTIPGFSVVRKGGTDGDAVFRGMAGSRLGILLDGQQILGGCGGRMDPPTAYVFPAAYDRITVLKGPQTVLYGAGTSAGTVLFERNVTPTAGPSVTMAGALTAGAFGRHDEMATARAATPAFYVEGSGTRSHTDDYSDGSGQAVHSLYTRWSASAAAGWMPNTGTRVELSMAQSDGRAAYADRTMDGTRFARDNVAVRFDKRFTSAVLQRVEAQSYYNYIDHVMDNFTLRTPGTTFSVNNPDRMTLGGRGAATLALGHATALVVGTDVQHNVHTMRSATGKSSAAEALAAYTAVPRGEDMRFTQVGLFAEVTATVTARSRLVAGARGDWHEALDSRACIGTMMCPGSSPLTNDTRGATDRRTLGSGFVRFERDLDWAGVSGRLSLGIGHVGRSPDYWERLKQDPTTLKSAFLSTKSEKTTQADVGIVWQATRWTGSVSAFYGAIQDYVLIRWQPTPTLTRNVDATTLGAEATVAYTLVRNLKADATLAFVRGENTTDGKPLAQQPPVEGRIGLTYTRRAFSLSWLARLVAAQNRVDVGSGNIVSNGMDLGPTPGFSVISLNGGYRFTKALLVAAGVDNLLNATYAEHISQGGAAVPGFVPTTRVNEPGRTAWVKVSMDVR